MAKQGKNIVSMTRALDSKLYKPGTMLKYLTDVDLFDELYKLHVEKRH